MTLSEELQWRGFINQTTLKDIKLLDTKKFIFYWGVDPSADSMQIGNLAMAIMIKLFIQYGHKPILLVGGATGMIGDPDGKSEERKLQDMERIATNKENIAKQYRQLYSNNEIEIVDNFDWFKDFKYLDFLRTVGKHVPMRQMLNREFIQTRLGDKNSGISYAEFSYVLMQAYDFLHLHQAKNVNLQVCGADQWGNCIAGVDLIRRITTDNVDVWSGPLIVNPQTGVKFGKSEGGAVWLDPKKTSVTEFYQFWLGSDDMAVEYYLKIYSLLSREKIDELVVKQQENPKSRVAQIALADRVTEFVHGQEAMNQAKLIALVLSNQYKLEDLDDTKLKLIRKELKSIRVNPSELISDALVAGGLATSNKQARQLIEEGAIYINHIRVNHQTFMADDFINNRLLLRRGKAYKDSIFVET